jgi:hypothetical protein
MQHLDMIDAFRPRLFSIYAAGPLLAHQRRISVWSEPGRLSAPAYFRSRKVAIRPSLSLVLSLQLSVSAAT